MPSRAPRPWSLRSALFDSLCGLRTLLAASGGPSFSPSRPSRFRPGILLLEDRVTPSVFTVNNFSVDDGTTVGTLRFELTQINPAGGDLIIFNTPGTVTLAAGLGPLVINNPDLTIEGVGAGSTISGNNAVEILKVTGGKLTLTDLTLTGGKLTGFNGRGAAIMSGATATLAISDSTVSGNSAYAGGGIYSKGTLTVTNCTFSSNTSVQNGGSVYIAPGGTATVTGSNFSTDSASNDGAAIMNKGTLSVQGCTITNETDTFFGAVTNTGTATLSDCILTGNTAGSQGGAVYNNYRLTVNDCTFSGNAAFGGGAISGNKASSNSFLTITNSTITGNTATQAGGAIAINSAMTLVNVTINNNRAKGTPGNAGGGIFISPAANTVLINSVVAGNFIGASPSTSSDDIRGGISSSSSNNLIGDGTNLSGITNGSQGNQVGTNASPINPLLAPLANYGGTTQTMALLPGSPALDAGLDVSAPLATPVPGVFSELIGTGLARGTYFYRISAINAVGETLASTEKSFVAGNFGTTNQVVVTWSAVSGATGYRIYGRTGGSEQLLTTVGAGVTSFTDTGTLTPAGALPTANNTALPLDQRGVNRKIGTAVDIGAFESGGFTMTFVSGTPQTTAVNTTFANPLVVMVTANVVGEPVDGGMISYIATPVAGAGSVPQEGVISGGVASPIITANTVAGSYTLTASAPGIPTQITFNLTNIPGPADPAHSFFAINNGTIAVDNSSTITFQAEDQFGNLITIGGDAVSFGLGAGSSAGTFSGIADNRNGTYTATFIGGTPGTARTITATINAAAVTSTLPTILVATNLLDVDGNGKADPLTDGILILRYMFKFTGTALTAGAIGAGATRTDAATIQSFLDGAKSTFLDPDGNGLVADPLTDGILILRYLFSFTGTALTSGALGAGATKTSGAQVITFLDPFNPNGGPLVVAIFTSVNSPTTTTPFTVTFVFNRPVTGFGLPAVQVTNGSKGNFVSVGDGNTYTVDVTPGGPATVTITVAANVVHDLAGNGNLIDSLSVVFQ